MRVGSICHISVLNVTRTLCRMIPKVMQIIMLSGR